MSRQWLSSKKCKSPTIVNKQLSSWRARASTSSLGPNLDQTLLCKPIITRHGSRSACQRTDPRFAFTIYRVWRVNSLLMRLGIKIALQLLSFHWGCAVQESTFTKITLNRDAYSTSINRKRPWSLPKNNSEIWWTTWKLQPHLGQMVLL